MVKQVPLPTSLFTIIFPSCFSIIFAQIARPKPVPTPTPFVVKPAVKILSIWSFGIPAPLSFIFIVMLSSCANVVISIVPVPSIAWQAEDYRNF